MSEKTKKMEEDKVKVLPHDKTEQLLTHLKVKNFMCFESLKVTCLNQKSVKFGGGEGDGKTAFILAILLGLGYDILPENNDATSLCGIQLSHVVYRGQNECRLDTTISLRSAPSSLQSVFGSYLTIIRRITKTVPLKQSLIQLAASDARGHCCGPIKKVTHAELRLTLELIGMGTKWYRLCLLDETNLGYLVHHPSEWYELYNHSFLEAKRKLLKEFLVMNIHLEKLEGDVSWRQVAETHLDLECRKVYVEDSLVLKHDRQNDMKALAKLQDSMKAIEDDIAVSRTLNSKCQKELEQLHIGFSYNMSVAFRNFLRAQNLAGNLLIDSDRKQIGVWINPPNPKSKEPRPGNIDEALMLWERTSSIRKRIAVMGLYFALWTINESCPVFLVDSFSGTETEFKLPERVMPVFMELIQGKAQESRTLHQQFVYTVQGQSHAPNESKENQKNL